MEGDLASIATGVANARPKGNVGTRRISGTFCRVISDYAGVTSDELTLARGELIKVLCTSPDASGSCGWWTGESRDRIGIFPYDYVAAHEFADKRNTFPPEIQPDDLVKGTLICRSQYCKVFKGTYRRQTVAIKELDTQGVNVAGIVDEADLEEEARLIWSLKHDHVIKLFGVFRPSLSLVMEHCAGGPLSHVLETKRIPLRTRVAWSLQIAKGMQYVHSRRVIHLDLKPSHILLTLPYRPDTKDVVVPLKISGFGLARSTDEDPVVIRGVSNGYRWQARETIKNYTFSPKSDVWSYGVLLWELVTGLTPYGDLDPMQVAYRVCTEKPMLRIPDTCPTKCRDLLTSCWSKDPQGRPDFEEIVPQLSAIADNSFQYDLDGSFRGMRDRQDEIRVDIDESRPEKLMTREEELDKREADLEERNDKLRQAAHDLQQREHTLDEREEELLRRESCY